MTAVRDLSRTHQFDAQDGYQEVNGPDTIEKGLSREPFSELLTMLG